MRQVPGVGRPLARGRDPDRGPVLAGAWTDTGWPDTMEGAVRSGLNAGCRSYAAAWVSRRCEGTGPGTGGGTPAGQQRHCRAPA